MDPGGPITGKRLCPICGVAEEIAECEAFCPPGWICRGCGSALIFEGGVPLYAPNLAQSETGFDQLVFDELAQNEAGHFWFEPRNRLLTGLAAKFCPGASRYLEIGCGTGFVLRAMADARFWSRVVGSELHPVGLAHAMRRLDSRAEFIQMDARQIPAREAFDLIGAFDVLEHIFEDEAVMREVYAALVPGGGFIAAVPQHPALWSQADVVAHHVRRYCRGELERKLQSAGFEIMFSTSYASVVLPLMALSRLRRRRPAPDENAVIHELSVPAALNAILRWVLNFEVGLSLGGWAWRIGGSRVVVARRAG